MFARSAPLLRRTLLGAGLAGAALATTTAFEPVRADALPAAAAGGAGRPVRAEATSPAAEDPSRGLHTRYGDRLVVLESPAIRALFTKIRAKDTPGTTWFWYADRLMSVLAEEGLAQTSDSKPTVIETPCGFYEGRTMGDPEKLAIVSIVRGGDSLLEAVRSKTPGSSTGKILIQRDETDPEKRPKLFYSKLPPDVRDRYVMLVDPMLATGGSACKAIEVLKEAGVRESNIMFLNVVSCPEGLHRLYAQFPRVKVVTAAVDLKLNADKYIVPGLGDYGDRYFNT